MPKRIHKLTEKEDYRFWLAGISSAENDYTLDDQLVLRRFDPPAEETLYRYRALNSTVRAMVSPSGRRVVVQVSDASPLRSMVVVADLAAGSGAQVATYRRAMVLPPLRPCSKRLVCLATVNVPGTPSPAARKRGTSSLARVGSTALRPMN